MKRAAAILICLTILISCLPVTALAEGEKSALLMELTTGKILQERNAHQRLAPASVTKIMTLLLIMEAVDGGKLRWEDPVTASETAAAKGGSQIYLKAGETMTVSDLVKAIAVSSANDCACAMAEHLSGSEEAFVGQMNRRAAELGMENTHFVNCTGLDDSPEARDHRTTAYDIAIMSRELLKNHPDIKKYTTIWMDTLRDGSFGLSNTNKLIRFYKGATGLKTGFTREAGFCLSASARREDMELIAVVLGAPSSRERFSACRAMLDYGFANFALARAQLPEKAQVPVVLGRENRVPVKLEGEDSLLVSRGTRVESRLELAPEVRAPVEAGRQLGELTLVRGEEILGRIPVVAAQGVEKLGWGSLFCLVLGRCAMAKKCIEFF